MTRYGIYEAMRMNISESSEIVKNTEDWNNIQCIHAWVSPAVDADMIEYGSGGGFGDIMVIMIDV